MQLQPKGRTGRLGIVGSNILDGLKNVLALPVQCAREHLLFC
jgi:hypothetical protein